jgi:hypothetical protein
LPNQNERRTTHRVLVVRRPKLTATGLVVVDFRERVKQARLKATAKLIEHIPEATPEPAA